MEVVMRGIDTPVRKMRREIFKEIAQLAYHSDNLNDDVEALPYKIVNPETPIYRESIYREREIVREQIRLAMGLSLRPEDAPVHVTQGLEESNIDEKYYEPPMIQVIPSACNACPENEYCVTDRCMGCVAHPCQVVCPRGAISTVNGKSVIDQSKCIRCGKCKSVCPYDAVSHQQRPCSAACGVGAIGSDGSGRAVIDSEKCVTCGQCMVSCPFGAIADKSQIFQLIHALESGREIIAQVAPAFVGQFGPAATPGKIKTALKQLGFADVYETAIGADIGAATEAEHYVKEVATGELPFLLTSCCPSWSMLAKKFFPETIDKISNALTPMVATARVIKKEHPDASVVFIGPCVAKKLEASRRSVRSDVDFVITFEELTGMFEAKGIDITKVEAETPIEDATSAGRGYAASGGVASAIEKCVQEYYPDTTVHIEHVESLADCKKILMLAKLGKKNGCLIEGMACPGGCIAGAGTNVAILQAQKALSSFQNEAERKIPAQNAMDEAK